MCVEHLRVMSCDDVDCDKCVEVHVQCIHVVTFWFLSTTELVSSCRCMSLSTIIPFMITVGIKLQHKSLKYFCGWN
jgi:hypothetical protein